jgi:hypothetical protein
MVASIETEGETAMLTKMMIHGLVAAILIGGAAAVYAQAKDSRQPSTAPVQATNDSGYLQSPADGVRKHKDGRKHAAKAERHREGHGRDNDRDDD